ncbi:hypothetical protein [Longimicrobium sp.]|uniref:hypothetical protein n=1 Tax=Longimicrobium sp. TaxID=2029185 RepID=UPI002E320D9D|nr:hypothetical protein [Longimicrobium sp.]HEX6041485.1 hypothetical protein [Longimicrobium sp.]
MTDYVLVFDAGAAPLVRATDFVGLGLLAFLGVALWKARGRRAGVSPPPAPFGNPAVLAALAMFVLLAMGVMAGSRYVGTVHLRERLRDGEYARVEGVVEDFVPGDREGHRTERWSVRSGGRTYRYAYRTSQQVPGFHQAGGPVREGLRVRVADVDGHIARLEVER